MPTLRADVAHLLRRTGFGGTSAEIDALVPRDLSTIVDGILALGGAPPQGQPWAFANESQGIFNWWASWKLWWYHRMVTTPTPLQEKIALFWHNHFVSASSRVRPDLMHDQLKLFRSQGLGNFGALTQTVARHPAMLVYLENHLNRVGVAQENFARELWELFMLGVDQYTQAEVVASARAWTGHSLTPYQNTFHGVDQYLYKPDWHDNGQKTIFGVTKNWDGPEVIDHTLDGPKREICARFICAKLWSFFAYPNPEPGIVNALAAVFLANNWEIRPVVRAMLLRPEFYSETAKTNLLRTPCEIIVAALRYSGVPVEPDNFAQIPYAVRPYAYDFDMGQDIGDPPDVSGWKQNTYWLSSSTFYAKAEFAHIVALQARSRGLFSAFATGASTPTQMADTALAQFGIDTPSVTTRQALIHYITADNTPSQRYELAYNAIRIILLSPDFAMA